MPRRLVSRQFWYAVSLVFNKWAGIAWVFLVIAVTIGFAKIETLAHQNSHRIVDIQESRLKSCEDTYRSFHAVFDPFFSPPAKRTAKEKSNIAKFNRIIAEKIKHCPAQITPPVLPKK